MSPFSLVVAVAFVAHCNAFAPSVQKNTASTTRISMSTPQDPLLLRAARGEVVESVPVWMMRQAGRHIKVSECRNVVICVIVEQRSPYDKSLQEKVTS